MTTMALVDFSHFATSRLDRAINASQTVVSMASCTKYH